MQGFAVRWLPLRLHRLNYFVTLGVCILETDVNSNTLTLQKLWRSFKCCIYDRFNISDSQSCLIGPHSNVNSSFRGHHFGHLPWHLQLQRVDLHPPGGLPRPVPGLQGRSSQPRRRSQECGRHFP